MFNDSSPIREFLRRTIRYVLFIGVGLFGIIYELAKSETIRWPLFGGYLFVIVASAYGMRVHAPANGDDENAKH